jgi:hypothetical protein
LSQNGAINAFVTFVAVSDDKTMVEACLLRQMLKGMGIANRSTFGQEVLVVASGDREFSTIDVAILRVLYDAKLTSGMTETQAMNIVRQIVSGTGKE